MNKLIKRVKPYTFRFYCTDNWKPYSSELPADIPIVSRKLTQSIEGTNLTLRTRLKRLTRKTIGYSPLEELHDKVIGGVYLKNVVSTSLKHNRDDNRLRENGCCYI